MLTFSEAFLCLKIVLIVNQSLGTLCAIIEYYIKLTFFTKYSWLSDFAELNYCKTAF